MNFVFVSPNFPLNYYHFVTSLNKNGVTVLGIGDTRLWDLTLEKIRISIKM